MSDKMICDNALSYMYYAPEVIFAVGGICDKTFHAMP